MIRYNNDSGYLWEGNCMDLFSKMVEKGKKVDGIVTSPPYNTARNLKSKRALDNHEGRYGKYDDSKTPQEYIDWTVDLFNNFDKVLNKNGCICYNLSYSTENIDKANLMWLTIAAIISETNFTTADVIYWKKSSALPNNVSHNKLTRIIEPVFVFCRKDEFKTFNGNKQIKSVGKNGQNYYENVFNFVQAPNNNETTSLNKATFSKELVHEMIDRYFKSDSILLDPFNGTGTTSVACIEKGCKFIGSEMDEAQLDHSIKRIEKLNNVYIKTVSNRDSR